MSELQQPAAQEDPPLMTGDQVLEFVQRKRTAIVKQLTSNSAVPSDPADKTVLMQALQGLSQQELTVRKIKVDEKANDASAGAQVLIAKLLGAMGSRAHNQTNVVDAVPRETPVLSKEVLDPVLLPGETDTSPKQLSYDGFIAEFGGHKA